ncbi:DUF3237 family protein [Pseudomonas syringae pv. tagetis]|uniref:Polyribonucleotide nucleotidyltransferase n=4 Tax=Pseudomonas syringae group genomosp. 7 TaxID=251699 RepID=A0A0P9RBE7_9PSED|nr:DUF3237 family protein [Pseudomonas syringae group genomosp. 7]KPX42526.1 Polyribonucleotide nucleotidyltransferase [Pseudomonas syringae pv. helianthi]RMR01895.1 Polyribonucleotide nucleotidyltransferase [Pseudomonas syringae pv. helianthi]RMW16503.1 Polyribonucleotide nucleotidyltransferase [Pseudomonas syringae pv. tagetis]RMW20158.1 Polyribonucleotide nucleotidyltransferase [Pseudomonas syringae pv. tagetis]UNB65526.1 DUF3237 domain-containing protein [Pseudomonas syringae pv. helianthi
METMQLHEILTVHLRVDKPQVLCRPQRGQRSSGEILGGAFRGDRLQGQVLAGGSLFLVPQDDDLARFSLYYTLLTDDGVKIDVVGEGLVAADETERAPLAQAHCRCTCSKQFSVPSGAHDYLQRNLYVGRLRVTAGDDSLLVSIFQVNEMREGS